ncbi:MAG TPA: hypothetical protein DCL48_01705 [Alphaproteobacteria bacterium]|nr:hypothetical protein [Alphaproteobacteria bacterium]
MAAVLTAVSAAAGPKPATITDIRAQLFYESEGTLSDNLFKQKDLALWNTIIGEGTGGGRSSSTLVTVEVTGKDVPMGDVKIEVVATGDKGKVLGKTVTDVMIYDNSTKFFAPLWLGNTGCEAIKVSAKITGKNYKAAPVTKTIPFACGE